MMKIRQYITWILLIACFSLYDPVAESVPSSLFDMKVDPSEVLNSNKRKLYARAPFTQDEINKHNRERSNRLKQRRSNAREKIKEKIENPDFHARLKENSSSVKNMTVEEIRRLHDEAVIKDPTLSRPENQWIRRVWSSSSSRSSSEESIFADTSQYYESWAQAYRMLGAFISCDLDDGNEYNYNYAGNNCNRWILWAAYLNPNYQGGGRGEYFGYDDDGGNQHGYYNDDSTGKCYRTDDGSYHCNDYSNYDTDRNTDDDTSVYPTSRLDCHDSNTEWQLLGVYRQDIYEFFEQVLKHVWYYNDYEYLVGSGGLEYIGENGCNFVSFDSNGNELYSSMKPMAGGNFSMGLYSDWQCLEAVDEEESGYNYDTFNGGDNYYAYNYYGDDDNDGQNYYYKKQNAYNRAQEHTLELFNEVFSEFKYCTLCMDYPSYQDGYFNGDYYGTDDDNLINQCWKFYSHDTYNCDMDCIAMADTQNTIVGIKLGSMYYGSDWEGADSGNIFDHYKKEYAKSFESGKNKAWVKANLFLLLNLAVFVTCIYITKVNGGISIMIAELRTIGKSAMKKRSHGGESGRSKNKKGWFRARRLNGIGTKKKKKSSKKAFGFSLPEILQQRSNSTSVFSSAIRPKIGKIRSTLRGSTMKKNRVGSFSSSKVTPITRAESASSKRSDKNSKDKARVVVKMQATKSSKVKEGVKGEVISVKPKKDSKSNHTVKDNGIHSACKDVGSEKDLFKKRIEDIKKKQEIVLGTNVRGKTKSNTMEEKMLHYAKMKEYQKKRVDDNSLKDEPKKRVLIIHRKKSDEQEESLQKATGNVKVQTGIEEEYQDEDAPKKLKEKKGWFNKLKLKGHGEPRANEKDHHNVGITTFDLNAFMTENVADDNYSLMTDNIDIGDKNSYQSNPTIDIEYDNYKHLSAGEKTTAFQKEILQDLNIESEVENYIASISNRNENYESLHNKNVNEEYQEINTANNDASVGEHDHSNAYNMRMVEESIRNISENDSESQTHSAYSVAESFSVATTGSVATGNLPTTIDANDTTDKEEVVKGKNVKKSWLNLLKWGYQKDEKINQGEIESQRKEANVFQSVEESVNDEASSTSSFENSSYDSSERLSLQSSDEDEPNGLKNDVDADVNIQGGYYDSQTLDVGATFGDNLDVIYEADTKEEV